MTVSAGTNTLLGLDPNRIAELPALLRDGPAVRVEPPALWDGAAAQRVADVLEGC